MDIFLYKSGMKNNKAVTLTVKIDVIYTNIYYDGYRWMKYYGMLSGKEKT